MGPIVASYEHEPIRGLLVSRFSNMERPPPFSSVGWRSERMAAKGWSRMFGKGEGKVVYFDSAECATCKYFILAA